MRFSERMGFKPVADIIQVDGMNAVLRNSLWNVLYAREFGETGFLGRYIGQPPKIEVFSRALWATYFKLPIDDRPGSNYQILMKIRDYFFTCAWHNVYDFIEFCVAYYDEGQLVTHLNSILEGELAGYRIIDGKVAPISSTEEIETIQEAIGDNTFPGASAHLKSALDLLSNKTNPDYRNSIKESISAVESACCVITSTASATLGEALKELAKKHSLHGALKDGFLKLYGYTSDSNGIRHCMLEESELTQADAVYFLVSCSAFVHYLKSKIISPNNRSDCDSGFISRSG